MKTDRFSNYELQQDIEENEKAYKKSKKNLLYIVLSFVVCLVMYGILKVVG